MKKKKITQKNKTIINKIILLIIYKCFKIKNLANLIL